MGSDEGEIMRWFDQVSHNAGVVQQETLRRILELNYGVEYLGNWLGDIGNVREIDANKLEKMYTTTVPLATHADVEPYIQRIADGDTSPILTQQRITHLSLSVYPTEPGGRVPEFIYSSKQIKTKGGLIAGTATTHYFSSKEFTMKQDKTRSFTCSPQEVISSGDYKQTTYCHLLLGLYFSSKIKCISSTFVYSIVHALATFEELWKDLCNDIREGSLSLRITIPSVRRAVLKSLTPNPCLAARIRDACLELERVNWSGLILKLWPNAKYVYSIMTGSMQPYLKKLRRYAGDLPLISADYGSTESWIGVNVAPASPPENVTFAVVPTFSYFEFIPLHRSCKNGNRTEVVDDFIEDDPVPLSNVKIGQQYEVVLTTFTGLYRYRLGDVVEESGFHKGTPKLAFVCRRKLILTVNIDKNTEKDLQLVAEMGSQLLSQEAELVDFTSHANVANPPGHYVIYWEIKGEVEEQVLNECCKKMDESFVDHGYVVSRRTQSIGPLELCIVERGTFKRILDYYIGNGAALSQFKTPRKKKRGVSIERERLLLTMGGTEQSGVQNGAEQDAGTANQTGRPVDLTER
ncbi:hypothetical protein Cgig2_015891 [Carnegiea gigantea]|uniref:Uncharacterized protein n=1 Tax=Carnegiea gigantea TaxID=171969 RepID=A0A9Q1GVT6_9CARY|nr:hypothetical protein Cgig2_015891 [Carnegiea gigantea]